MDLQNTVKEALNALNHHPDDAVRAQADRWLPGFPALNRRGRRHLHKNIDSLLDWSIPSSRLEEVSYVLLALTSTYGVKVLEWAKGSISLIPSAAITEVESASFLRALSDAASGSNSCVLQNVLEELSDVCRWNRKVQEIVQGALRPLDLHFTAVS